MKNTVLKVIFIIGCCMVGMSVSVAIFLATMQVAVPNVSGKVLEEGREMLQEQSLKIEIKTEFSDTVPEGTIIRQSIAADEKMQRGSTVIVTVSGGVELFAVPDVNDLTLEEAAALLSKHQFSICSQERFSAVHEKGRIIAQEPKVSEKAPKGTAVKVFVSKGPDLVAVPDIVGKSLEQAEQLMADAGLELSVDIKCSGSVKEGIILSQEIKAGEMAHRHSQISGYVSAGVANKVGNTPSNSNRSGQVALQGNWVYYANTNYDYHLYKMKKDGSQKQLLSEGSVQCINVLGEWIYYYQGGVASGSGIYKIRIDGSKRTKISGDYVRFLHVEDGWMYMQNPFGTKQIYRMKTDGSQKALICNDPCGDILVIGKWIYYINLNDNHLYKIRTDGTQKTILNSKVDADSIAVQGDLLAIEGVDGYYYLNLKTGAFHGNRQCNTQKMFLNANDGWLYFIEHTFEYSKTQSAFYKMKPDGSQKTRLMPFDFLNRANYFICVADGWIYFPNDADNDYLYRLKTDGTTLEKVYEHQ